ncbi:4'-phosphopantetheinyl transferase superfamily protein [Cyanobium sp. HWJ4-Hawea]|uniref:4'-phosphopantetheinyl transferase family protein n=1 Tax=Cyanobium sp. HWJ4-Hawea TaxID=2823713 RepID=UPI0020CC0482|nr:4'-phosphopantetheinyl transferase superfamily protein [Cyanobium sp. HWJ4-Hawea]MCP9809751.1 4'-phosphopantetheinyl transferase superfamily protein [Cyanobium sp. HWJ4-Hawea]
MEALRRPILEPGPRLWLQPLGVVDAEILSSQELAWGGRLAQPGQRRYWQSRAAVRQQLAPLLGCDPAQVPLYSPPGEAPQLLEGCGWVSLSHSGDGLLIGYCPEPIGVDLERADRRLDAVTLLERFYPKEEAAQLRGLGGDSLRLAVLTSWVAKEAAIKWRRRSLAEELAHWCFDHRQCQLHHRVEGLTLSPRMGLQNGWLWAAVTPAPAPILGP